jgi:hypothetical protein
MVNAVKSLNLTNDTTFFPFDVAFVSHRKTIPSYFQVGGSREEVSGHVRVP